MQFIVLDYHSCPTSHKKWAENLKNQIGISSIKLSAKFNDQLSAEAETQLFNKKPGVSDF